MPKPVLGRLVAEGVVPLARPGDFGDLDLDLRPSAIMVGAVTISGVRIAGAEYKVTMTREQLGKAISLIDDFNKLMDKEV